jgi:uncharacterized protein involved in response to NO
MQTPAHPSAKPDAPPGCALFALGFRPFYLLAGAYAALAVPLWALQYAGWLPGANILWHAHEMILGYAFAVIAGFLLTAVRAWTGRPTPAATALAAIAALLLLARALALVSLPAAAVAGAFAMAVAWAWRRSSRRATGATCSSSRSCSGRCGGHRPAGLAAARHRARPDVVLFVMTVVSGRVVPMFTNNAIAARARAHRLAGESGARRDPRADRADASSSPCRGGGRAGGGRRARARLALWSPHKTLRADCLDPAHRLRLIVAHLLLRGLAASDSSRSRSPRTRSRWARSAA